MTLPAVPAPPASFFWGWVTSSRATAAPVTGSLAKGCARRTTLPFGTRKAVSVIFSGVKIRSWKNCPSVTPLTASTTRPSTSVDRLYSQAVPG